MTDNSYELVQHCIDSDEFVTVKCYDRYLLIHKNIVKYSDNHQLDLELSPSVIRKFFSLKSLSIADAQRTEHVALSYYDVIVFPDKSIVYTHKRTLSHHNDQNENTKKMKILPYYVCEDLELLRKIGLSKDDIDLFITKLNEIDNIDTFNSEKYDRIIQKIINYTDIPTRLTCRQVSNRWKNFVDNSISWKYVKLSKHYQYIDRALNYFQNIDIRELDLSESTFEPFGFELNNEFHLYSLRLLSVAIDHPFELFTLLFKLAPFLQHIKLIQTHNSIIRFKNNNNQLYDCINFVIYQCQQRLKCLRRLHIQLRSASDQMVEERNFQFWRRLLIVFNIFYIILALTFFFFAIFTRVNSLIIDLHLFIGLIILSLYLIFVSVFGIIAIAKHHQVLLFFYIILLFLLFLFQFILACTYLTIRGDKKENMLKENYEKSIDRIQLKYNCCGFNNLTYFNRTIICKELPCCHSINQCCETLPTCYTLLYDELNKNFKIIGSIMLIFTLTQILAIYMTLKFRNIRNPTIFISE